MSRKFSIALLLVLFTIICTAQSNQSRNPVRVDTTLSVVQNQFVDNQDEALLNQANKVFSDYPPTWPEPSARRSALMLLDAVFYDAYSQHRAPVQLFFKTRIKKAIEEIEQAEIVNGVRIWKLYNHAFVIRTKTVTIAFDLTGGESARAEGFQISDDDIERLIKQCDVLFISHFLADHAQERVAQSFINQGKPVVAPPDGWKNKPIFESITHLERVANLTQTLPVQGGKQVLKIIIYPGHLGADMENNASLVITPEGLLLAHLGDQSYQDDFNWIDEAGNNHAVDVLMPNCWAMDLVRVVKGFKPSLVITGHEHELGHTRREPYWLTYQKLEGPDQIGGINKVGYNAPFILMTWGESYHYLRENF